MRKFTLIVLLVSASLAFAANTSRYELIDLGPGSATCISNTGYIGGSFGIWHDGQIIDNTMEVLDINDSGNAVGSKIVNRVYRSFYRENGSWKDIGTLGGSACWVSAINNSDKIAGTSVLSNGQQRVFIYENAQMSELDPSLTGVCSALDINNSGDVLYRSNSETFIWSNGVKKKIPSLGGTYTGGRSINEFRQVVGESSTVPGTVYGLHAFFYDSINGMTDLGTLGGYDSYAYGINNRGQIVGSATSRAFLYDQGEMIDLNIFAPENSEWVLLEMGMAINDYGQIVGTGIWGANFQNHAFLLNPIPEPATLLLLGLGGLLLRRK